MYSRVLLFYELYLRSKTIKGDYDMDLIQDWVNSKGIKINYIDNHIINSKKTPLLICPGLSESAQDYIKIIERLNDRRCIALSFRGRGKSDSPEHGYTLTHHLQDIHSIVECLNLDKFCIMGYSRGASYALGYSLLNQNALKGLILGEYPAQHKKMPTGWARDSMEFYNSHCQSISIKYNALEAIEKESEQIYFKDQLPNITCNTLILKGEKEETLLTIEDISEYIQNLGSKSIRIKHFENSGHDIKEDEFESLINVLEEFLESVDD